MALSDEWTVDDRPLSERSHLVEPTPEQIARSSLAAQADRWTQNDERRATVRRQVSRSRAPIGSEQPRRKVLGADELDHVGPEAQWPSGKSMIQLDAVRLHRYISKLARPRSIRVKCWPRVRHGIVAVQPTRLPTIGTASAKTRLRGQPRAHSALMRGGSVVQSASASTERRARNPSRPTARGSR